MSKQKPAIGESFQSWPGDDAATIRNFIDELERFGKRRFKDEIARFRGLLVELSGDTVDADWPDRFANAIDAACESLSAYAQERNPYLHFAANENWPESFGFWADVESARSDAEWTGDNLGEMPRGFTGIAVTVNDHGNVSAYRVSRGRAYELFAGV